MSRTNRSSNGFTIVELMISISVFSVILLICISAIIYVGRLYYLGVTQAKAQEVARTTLDTISDAVKFNSAPIKPVTAASGWDGAYCIGNRKYSYKLYKVLTNTVEPGTNQTTQALVESIDPACQSTTTPVPVEPVTTGDPPTKELLAKFMRLNSLSISTSVATGLTTISISVVYGGDGKPEDSEIFNFDTTNTDLILSCKSGVGGSQFCAVKNLVKTVYGV